MYSLLAWLLLMPAQVSVRVTVRNIQPGAGSIRVAFYNSDNTFLHRPADSLAAKAQQQTMTLTFKVPAGDYAIATYQDLNDNGQLDAGLFRAPKEPYGFGTGYRPHFSAPAFKECVMHLTGDTTVFVDLK